ncbi:MAG: phosphate/phosphite/phosphonate ABC transporter substrate-binding protein [Gammaproteobacteria bacterium]|nr:phosphate/phosphite/phosphonate ABC transporter substrate-binding protein [Gammaproteobacteria bacterium]
MGKAYQVFVRVSVLSFILITISSTVNAQLIFTAPPRETPAEGEKLYAPLVNHLRTILKTDVKYEHPHNWLNYQKHMRAGKYDIVFDGAHFVSWRVEHLKHKPLVKLPTPYQIVLYTRKDQKDINSPADLIGKRICGLGPPNLVTMLSLSQFPYPARQPILIPVRGGQKGLFKAFQEGRCVAGTNRTHYFNKKIPADVRKELKVLYTSDVISNQAISAGPKVTTSQGVRIKKSLSSDPEGIKATRPILDRFAKQASAMVGTNTSDYQGYNKLLEGVVFGW